MIVMAITHSGINAQPATAGQIKPGDQIGTPYGPATVNATKPWGYVNGEGPTSIVCQTSKGTIVYGLSDPYPRYTGCTVFCARKHPHN